MTSEEVPVLAGDGVRLRPLAERDVAVRAALGVNREIVRWFGGDIAADTPMTEHGARTQLETRFGPGPHWVIADSSDQFIGVARLAPINEGDNSARFAIGILDPNRLGEGLGTKATSLIVRYGFDRLKLARIDLTVLTENSRAIAVYTKCGFVEVGRTSEALRRDGRWYEDLHMAIHAPTEPELRTS